MTKETFRKLLEKEKRTFTTNTPTLPANFSFLEEETVVKIFEQYFENNLIDNFEIVKNPNPPTIQTR